MSRGHRGVIRHLAAFVLVLTASPAFAEWIPLGHEATAMRVLDSSPDRIVVEMTLEGVERATHTIDGRVQAAYALPTQRAPGATAWMVAGDPQLPVLRQSLMIPDQGAFEARVVSSESITLWTEPILPSKGNLPRTVDPSTVALRWNPVYERDAMFPAENARLLEPYILRDFRGAVLELSPFRYNPQRSTLEVTTKMTIEIVPSTAPARNELLRANAPGGIDPAFADIYGNVFGNWNPLAYTAIPEPGRLLIVSHSSLLPAAQTLLQWKTQKGFKAELVNMADLGTTDDQLKVFVQQYYDSPGSLTYLILVGDSGQIPIAYGPTENAPSDPMYSLLAGNDSYPDIFVSRISAQTLAQAENQVAKFLRYEREPDLSAPASNWYPKALGIGSADGSWSGYTDCERLEFLEDYLLNFTYSTHTKVCDPGASDVMVANAVNDGRSIVNYIGHGSGTSWSTSGFNVADVHNLNNGHKQPFILDVSCTNGGFNMNESFAEAWLRTGSVANPRGAIGMYSSSLVCSWIPPCQMQLEAVRVIVEGEVTSVGGSCFSGIMEALDLNPGYDGLALFEEYNVFGDCTLQLRTAVPAQLPTLVHDATVPAEASTFEVTVPGVVDALVSFSAGGVLYGSAYTDEVGLAEVTFDVPPVAGTQLTLTVTAFNRTTVIEQLEVANPSLASMIIEATTAVDLGQGTSGNTHIEAGEAVELTLGLRNVGIETAAALLATLSTTSPHATVTVAQQPYGDIAPDALAQNAAPFVVQISPTTPDGTEISFLLTMEVEGGDWTGVLPLQVVSPVVTLQSFTLDDSQSGTPNGVLDAGETANLSIVLHNAGGGDAANLVADLTARNPQVTVIQGQASLGYLAATQADTPGPVYQIQASANLNPGIRLPFDVAVTGGNGFEGAASFNLDLGNGTADVGDGLAIARDRLEAPSPNPVVSRTQVAFALAREQPASLVVYDARGRAVRTLAQGTQPAGQHTIQWDGRDGEGRPLPSGVYFVQLATPSREISRAITLVR